MTYAFQPGDYIRFQRIVQPERKVRHRTDYATGRPIVVPAIPEQVLPQAGDGRIATLSKAKKRVKVDRTASGKDVVESFTVARVHAGSHLGTVTAILDDAVLVAKQQSMELDLDAATEAAPSIYDTTRGGIA